MKLHFPNAVSMQGQSCRRMPIIEPTLSVYSNNLLIARFDS